MKNRYQCNSLLLFIASLITPLTFTPIASAVEQHKAHVHGNGKIDLALESPTKLMIELDFPGDSIFGFEHKARTNSDKQTQKAAFEKLRHPESFVISFDPSLGCKITVSKVEIEKEAGESSAEKDEHHGEHQDVNASYEVNCARALTGSKVRFPIIESFPRVKKISVQVLSESSQNQKDITRASDTISL